MNNSHQVTGSLLFPMFISAIAIGMLVHRIWTHSKRPKPLSEQEIRLFRGESLELRGALVLVLAALFWVGSVMAMNSWLPLVAYAVGGLGFAMVVIGSYRRRKAELGG
jgi:hypothetical protein